MFRQNRPLDKFVFVLFIVAMALIFVPYSIVRETTRSFGRSWEDEESRKWWISTFIALGVLFAFLIMLVIYWIGNT